MARSIKTDFRRLTDGNAEHREILHAVEDRDADQVVKLISEHLRSTVRAVESALSESSGSAEANG